MSNLDQAQLNQIVAAVIAALHNTPGVAPKAATVSAKPGFDFAAKDSKLIAAFRRKGFRDVVLAPRNPDGSVDLTKPHNCKPFKTWVSEGMVPRKGSKSIFGLFHITQCDPVPGKSPPKGGKRVKLQAVPTQPAA